MSMELITRMTNEEKTELVLNKGSKSFIRKFCGITPSKLLILEKSSKHALKRFVHGRIERMTEESFQEKIKELL